jgi:uncharacterized protein (TIGR00266 family)
VLYKVRCRPAFAALFITLAPGESITVKKGALVSMDGDITIKTCFFGGWLWAIVRKCFGGKCLYVDNLTNNTPDPLTVVLSHDTVGDISPIDLSQGTICLQPGVYLAHTKKVTINHYWAGFGSWLAGEGFFKLKLKGRGRVFIAAYGGILKKTIYKDLVMKQGHLLAYSPKIRLKYRKEEQKVNIMVPKAKKKNQRTQGTLIYYQSRTFSGLINYLRSLV